MREWNARTWTPAAAAILGGCTAYLFAATLVTGCRPAAAPGGETGLPAGALIAVIGTAESHPSWKGISGGARRYDEERPNLDCLLAAPPDGDPATLATLIDLVCEKHPAAICLCVEDPDAARPTALRIVSRGILLVTIGKPLADVGAFGHVELDLPGAAELLGANLAAIAGGRRSYALIHEDGRDQLGTLCHARFISAARSQAALTLLEARGAAGHDGDPQALVREMLRRFPHVGLIVTLNPQPWLTLQPRLRLPPQNRFATLAAPPLLWSRLRSGEAAALVGPLDGEIGYAAMDLAVQGLMHILDAQTRRVVRCELVTPATLEDFARRYASAAGLDPADLLPVDTAPLATSRPPGE